MPKESRHTSRSRALRVSSRYEAGPDSKNKGRVAGRNPWRATTLEWQTPDTPPTHGNWGATQPLVYRWAYDYSVPGAAQDFLPQNLAPDQVTADGGDQGHPDVAVQPAE